MKQTLSMMVFAGAVAIITLSSCTKEQPVSDSNFVSPSSYSPPDASQTVNLSLVANNWVNYDSQVYINTFKGVLATANVNGNREVTVYVMDNGKEEQISQRHITYLGNELWATNTGVDVSIVYRCSGPLPFSFLNIRVQVKTR